MTIKLFQKTQSYKKKIRATPHAYIYPIISQEPKYFWSETSEKGWTSCFKSFSGLKKTRHVPDMGEKWFKKNRVQEFLWLCFFNPFSPTQQVQRVELLGLKFLFLYFHNFTIFSRPSIYIFFTVGGNFRLTPSCCLFSSWKHTRCKGQNQTQRPACRTPPSRPTKS